MVLKNKTLNKNKPICLNNQRANMLLRPVERKFSSEIIKLWAQGERLEPSPAHGQGTPGQPLPQPKAAQGAGPHAAHLIHISVTSGCLGSGWLILSLLTSTLKGCLLG